MNKTILAAAFTVLAGCNDFLSVHRLAEDQDSTFDERLLGAWKNEDDRWTFTKADGGAYHLLVNDEKHKTFEGDCRLVSLGSHQFLDVYGEEEGSTAIPGHQFLQVRLNGDTLEMGALEHDWMKKVIVEQRTLAHTRLRRGKASYTVITAPPLELQQFLMRHARDEEAFEWSVFSRQDDSGHREP